MEEEAQKNNADPTHHPSRNDDNADTDTGENGESKTDSRRPSPPRRTLSQAEANLSHPDANVPLYKIVLTGGPCGGKTTALARLSSYLRDRGFEVMTCPEAFSIMISNGMSMEYFSVEGIASIVQGTVMDLQCNLEDGFASVLRARGKPAVLLCDRGLMDGSAYVDPEEWEQLLASRGVESEGEIREGRYNAVFHLVTAAEGAERYYTLENNAVRTETPDEARRLDSLTRAAWVGHSNLCVFDNSTNFEVKLHRVVAATAKLVGLPSTLRRVTTKFLLRGLPIFDAFPPDVKYHVFEVEKVYLYDDVSGAKKADSEYAEEYSFIRRRSQGKGAVYGQTTVKRAKSGQEIELKRIITEREYISALKTRDMSRHIIKQKRISFIWHMQSFNVHIYLAPIANLCILHCQVEGGDDGEGKGDGHRVVSLPPFLDVERHLHGKEDNEKYGAYSISLIDKVR